MADKQHIQELIRLYREGTSTEDEYYALLDHFGIDSQADDVFRLLQEAMASGEAGKAFSQPQIDRITANARLKLDTRMAGNKTRTFRISSLLPYAAAILIACAGYGLYRFVKQTDPPDTALLVSRFGDDVGPGGNRATLTLADGRIIALSEEKEGVTSMGTNFKYDDGTQIENLHTQYVQLSTPRGGQYRVTLPDGTNVFLNAESSLEYPIAFGQERIVKLSGEGFFEIKEDKSKPFLVQSANQTVKVLGTTFNMNTYQESTVTTLVSGRLSLASNNGRTEILEPNQQATLQGNVFEIKKVDVGDYVAWTRGFIVINNATITDVIKQVERWYDVDFQLHSQAATTAYVSINRESKLSEVLEALEINYGIKFKIDERRIIEIE